MASRNLGTFALRVLEIARTSPTLSFEDIFTEYKVAYGSMSWATFAKKINEAWQQGYIGLSGGTFSSSPDAKFAVEIETQGPRKVYKQLYTKIDGRTIAAGIEKLKDELGVDLLRNANRELFDAMVRHQIMLLKLDRKVRNDIFALLDKTEADLAAKIAGRLQKGRSALGTARLQQLESFIRNTRLDAWDQVTEKWIADLIDVAKTEVKTQAGITQTASPVVLDLTMPSVSALKKIVQTNPFQGKTLKQWADSVAEADVQRIIDQIKIGLVQGETGDQIAARVVGTARNRAGGVTQISRNNAEAITRTAINALTHAAREAFYEENASVFGRERFVATLDSRTTPVCRANDGKIFPLGEGPRPPLHFNCRSIRVPYFDDAALSGRPARAYTEKGLLREFAKREGIEEVTDREDLPFGYKGLYDTFARQQIRLMTTIVPGAEKYSDWLLRQPKDFVDDVLGVTRSRLFRTGQLTLEKFVDTSGKNMSLHDLAMKHAAAFRSAGLDPEDFL